MTTTRDPLVEAVSRSRPLRALYAGNARSVMQRGWSATRSTNWLVIVSGFFEPIFYLLSLGIGFAGWSATSPRPAASRCRTRRSSPRRCWRRPR